MYKKVKKSWLLAELVYTVSAKTLSSQLLLFEGSIEANVPAFISILGDSISRNSS